MENSFRDEQPLFQLKLDDNVKAHMQEAARWGKFLAIVGFIIIGIMVIGGIFVGIAVSAVSSVYGSGGNAALGLLGGTGLALIYILLAAIYFYPVYALLKFSSLSKAGLNENNQEKFTRSFSYLKGMFRYCGILVIVVIALYLLFFIFIGIGGAIG